MVVGVCKCCLLLPPLLQFILLILLLHHLEGSHYFHLTDIQMYLGVIYRNIFIASNGILLMRLRYLLKVQISFSPILLDFNFQSQFPSTEKVRWGTSFEYDSHTSLFDKIRMVLQLLLTSSTRMLKITSFIIIVGCV